jgi:hypothetical protein
MGLMEELEANLMPLMAAAAGAVQFLLQHRLGTEDCMVEGAVEWLTILAPVLVARVPMVLSSSRIKRINEYEKNNSHNYIHHVRCRDRIFLFAFAHE